ncbi:MAG: two-component system sensor histidine kinase KdpD [Paucibacter sp.]|nr:two-component system sensor histidine kinase KdpD [Roseateles sp.]
MIDGTRPDPDALLARLREEEQAASRGRLRIYFGSSAGVGKTYAMLQAARKLQAEGVDVLAGVVVTHGRSETEGVAAGLPQLPLKNVDYRGKSLPEFDLDAALARKPALILVDELAHSNVLGSRHPKRWQDVEELLANGISVYTTLNVQHLESLNDIVGGITGVRVQETLPDTFFDRADEVVLVDTPADELLARLKAGKVYMGPAAERAASNFFRKGNLMALRELALRRTADRVEEDVQVWRSTKRIAEVWKTDAAILCSVGPTPAAESVVRSAAQLAQQLGVSWHAVYVETPALQRLPDAQRERILRVVRGAHELGAATAVLQHQDVAAALAAYAREHNLSKLVLGRGRSRRWWATRALTQKLAAAAPELDLIAVATVLPQAAASRAEALASEPERPWPAQLRRHAMAVLACAATAAVCEPLARYFDLANIVMLFLLCVVGVALRLGRGPAVLASFVSVGLFDFFFVPPQLSFAVSDVQYLLTFAVMLVVGLVTGQLTAGLRYEARVAAERETRSRALFELTSDLGSALLTEQVVEVSEQVLAREVHGRALLYTLDVQDRLQPSPHDSGADVSDSAAARWAFDHGRPAGLTTDTLPGSPWYYLPLVAAMRTRGVLALKPSSSRSVMQPELRAQLETYARIIAQALERVHYVEVAQQALVQIESERLRNSLLSALSHDLRTPLAAVYGTAQTLAALPDLPGNARDLSQALSQQAQRITAMVNNLLDMARLQSGTVRPNLQWQPLEEVVGSALRAMEPLLAHHHVELDLPADLPLVQLDAALMERVLANLLENAAKYTPPGSCVRISGRVAGAQLELSVADNGPGLPPQRVETLFDKFTRGERESSTPGVGLGLAICRAIVEAHGGSIHAANAEGGGAVFHILLPLGTPPDLSEAENADE